ncbi:MAG TPA: PAS domain-containing sensor histidine kinase [Gammaproteobacteria bacterium]|nr:PAS domain-containing sensor histidine kinase [Gammaproteobacteria bacterium]|tara:strand:+ start:736 stop:1785 length:1050 start_codon:yes stop_codon:yes gene_type:complete
MTENILNNLCTAVIALDHELRVCFINQSAESLLEISANRSLGTSLAELVCGFDPFTPMFYDAIQSGQPYSQRMAEFVLASGTHLTMDFTISPISEGEWPRLLLEMNPLDRYLRIDRDAALNEQQEISKQIIRGLAHEVKNPLGGIRGSAQLLEKQLELYELKEYTNIIIEETDRLTQLVDQMLGPTRLPKPESTNIHVLLERVSKLIELEFPDVEIVKDYDPSIPEVLVDPEMFLQALLNISRNAMQSMTGTSQAKLAFTTRIERQFTINATRHRTVIRIEITDNGCGIPPDLKQNLFYPMISGRPDGTGLGLPLVHAVIHQHDGYIEFDSEPGVTTFRIFIPFGVGES